MALRRPLGAPFVHFWCQLAKWLSGSFWKLILLISEHCWQNCSQDAFFEHFWGQLAKLRSGGVWMLILSISCASLPNCFQGASGEQILSLFPKVCFVGWSWNILREQFLTLFTRVCWVCGQAWKADFVVIYVIFALSAGLGMCWEGRFFRYLRGAAASLRVCGQAWKTDFCCYLFTQLDLCILS